MEQHDLAARAAVALLRDEEVAGAVITFGNTRNTDAVCVLNVKAKDRGELVRVLRVAADRIEAGAAFPLPRAEA